MVAEGYHTYHSEYLIIHIITESLCCTTEVNIILYNNYIPKKIITYRNVFSFSGFQGYIIFLEITKYYYVMTSYEIFLS